MLSAFGFDFDKTYLTLDYSEYHEKAHSIIVSAVQTERQIREKPLRSLAPGSGRVKEN